MPRALANVRVLQCVAPAGFSVVVFLMMRAEGEITLFKSIGMALSDLVGAGCAYRASSGK
jgi:hypothetical protein